MDLEDRDLKFHNGENSVSSVPLNFIPGEGSLWFVPDSFVSSTSSLVGQGPIRIVTTLDPPPNIGGLVSALDAGSLIGASLTAPRGWWEGESPFPDNGDRINILYDGGFFPIQSEFFKTEAYIGLEFEIGDEVHYGWLSVALEPGDYPWNSRPSSTRITGFAYETEPGVSIITKVIPEPSMVLLFSFGIGALCLSRRNCSASYR